MPNPPQSISSILIKLFNSFKAEIAKNIQPEQMVQKVAPKLVDDALNNFKQYAQSHGVAFNDDVIDLPPLSPKTGRDASPSGSASQTPPADATPETSVNWFDYLRQKLNTAVMDLAKAVNLESVGRVLTLDVKTIFGLNSREAALVENSRRIGESIGEVLDRHRKFPIFRQIAGQIAVLLSGLSFKIINNRNLIIETEYARENLEALIAFGVRYEELRDMATELFERLHEADRSMGAAIAENEALKSQVLQNIRAAHQRVNAGITATQERQAAEMDTFESELGEAIGKL